MPINKEFVKFDNVDKSYDGKILVVKGLQLDIAEGEDVTPREDVVETTSDKTALDKERNRNRFNFAQIGIEVGEELEFKKDKSIKAKVLDNDLIEFKGRPMSLSQSALEIVQEMGYTWNKIAGPQFWMYKGKTLYELNNQ